MREAKDRGSQWLMEHHARAVLFLGGVRQPLSCRHLRTVLVHPRRLPDGLFEVRLADRPEPILYLVEIETYPDRRLGQQVLDDTMLVMLERGVLPEVVTLILHPKGQFQVTGTHQVQSVLGGTQWAVSWQVVELWNLKA